MKKQNQNNNLTIGRALSQLRKSKGITQERLEELSGIPRRTIQNIEYGKVKEPKLKVMRTLLAALDSGFKGLGIDMGHYELVGDENPSLAPKAPVPRAENQPDPVYERLIHAKSSIEQPSDSVHLLDLFFSAPANIRAVILALSASDQRIAEPYYSDFAAWRARLLKSR